VLARSHTRFGLVAITTLALAVGMLWAGSVAAIAADTTPTTGCPTPAILTGMNALGATVSTPGAKTRTLDKDQATAFMQTWLAYSVFDSPPQERPPANLPVSRLTFNLLEDGQPATLLIFYASNGTKAWVGATAPTPAPPPNDQKWILAPKPAETIAAFAGTMAPICVDPTTSASTAPATPTTLTVAVKHTGTSSDSGTPWILIIVGVLVVAAGAVAATRVRRRRSA
jgi:hypothetical protein